MTVTLGGSAPNAPPSSAARTAWTGIAGTDRGASGRGDVSGPRLRLSVMLLVLLLGAVLGAIDLRRPLDGTSREIWRESDESAIARSYYREGMHLLYPRVDWRGDGPGYVEMEFPLYPYMMAIAYQAFGVHEVIGRMITFALALTTLWLFLLLARHTLPPPGAVAAGLFFAVNPIFIRLANSIQPEPLMLLGYVGAVYAFIRWLDDDRWWWYGWALAFTVLAVLGKVPAVHLGIVFVLFTLWRRGWREFLRPRLWLFAAGGLAPSVAWYHHAHEFWLTYGNSLGASNHRHIVGLQALTNPFYANGIAGIEVPYVWTAIGLVAVVGALILGPRPRATWYGLIWYVAVLIYYLVIAGTSAYGWAQYYHVVSVPPAALLVGSAVAAVWTRVTGLDTAGRRTALLSALLALVLTVAARRADPNLSLLPLVACAVATVAFVVGQRVVRRGIGGGDGRAGTVATGMVACAAALAPLSALRQTVSERHPHRYVADYATAMRFSPLIPPGVLIAASGGGCVSNDESAYNAPWYLYWTDHRGFTPCRQQHTMPDVDSLVARGVRYFIAERRAMDPNPGFEAAMRGRYPVLAETPIAVLFELDASAAALAVPAPGPRATFDSSSARRDRRP